MLGAGARDRKIIVQRATVTQNEFNEPVEAWTELVTLWARERPLKGQERFNSPQILGERVSTFETLFYPGITIKDRISYDGLYWNITNIAEQGRGEGLAISAQVLA